MATKIKTPQDLDNIRNNLSDTFELANDIDMSEFGVFTPIRNFDGVFDGKGHVIKNLKIRGGSGDDRFFGLFGNTYENAPVKNVGLEDVDVDVSFQDEVGGLVGASNGEITNCFVTGKLHSTGKYLGGLIGQTDNGTVKNCYTDVKIDALQTGGLFVGNSADSSVHIENNYATGTLVYGANVNSGFIGHVDDFWTPTFKNNHFDSDKSGTTTGERDGVTANTTAEMKDKSTYKNWNFNDVWSIDDGNSYPKLQVVLNAPKPTKKVKRDINSYVHKINATVSAKLPPRIALSYVKPIQASVSAGAPPKIKEIVVSSHVKPIYSNVDVKLPPQIKNVTLNSFVNKVTGNTAFAHESKRNISTYLSSIKSKVTVSVKNDHIDSRNINSYINPIYSNLNVKTYHQPILAARHTTSHIKQIQGYIELIKPIDTLPVVGYISVIENPSNATHVVNPSYCEVVK